MGLGLAGAISGAGNAMTQGLQTLNSGIVQMGINQSLAKNDREFQMKKLELQQQFEREMQTEKMTADKANTLAIVEAQGGQARKTQAERLLGEKDIHAQDQAAADARADKERTSREKLHLYDLKLKATTHIDDAKALESRFKRELSLKERQLKATQEKPTTIQTDDGRVALMDPQGKSLGYFSDEKGEAIRVASPIPQAERLKIESLMKEAHDAAMLYGKDSFRTPEKDVEYKRDISRINQEIDQLLAPYRKKSDTSSQVPRENPVKNLGKFSTLGPRPQPSPSFMESATRPNENPLDMKRTLIPGYGLIERAYKKMAE